MRRVKRKEICNSAPNFNWNFWEDDNLYDAPTFENKNLTDESAIIPRPWNHVWWRQLQSGNFLDFIYDCPFEMHELTSNARVSKALKELSDNHKEVFYYRVVKQYSPQKTAAIREQTDRNIRLLYDNIIEDLRDKLAVGHNPKERITIK